MVKVSCRNYSGQGKQKIGKPFDLKAYLYDNIIKHIIFIREKRIKKKCLSPGWKDFFRIF